MADLVNESGHLVKTRSKRHNYSYGANSKTPFRGYEAGSNSNQYNGHGAAEEKDSLKVGRNSQEITLEFVQMILSDNVSLRQQLKVLHSKVRVWKPVKAELSQEDYKCKGAADDSTGYKDVGNFRYAQSINSCCGKNNTSCTRQTYAEKARVGVADVENMKKTKVEEVNIEDYKYNDKMHIGSGRASEDVVKANAHTNYGRSCGSRRFKQRNDKKELKPCKFCDKKHLWGSERCPAFGKTCTKCMMKNHIADACRNRSCRRMAIHRSLPNGNMINMAVKDPKGVKSSDDAEHRAAKLTHEETDEVTAAEAYTEPDETGIEEAVNYAAQDNIQGESDVVKENAASGEVIVNDEVIDTKSEEVKSAFAPVTDAEESVLKRILVDMKQFAEDESKQTGISYNECLQEIKRGYGEDSDIEDIENGKARRMKQIRDMIQKEIEKNEMNVENWNMVKKNMEEKEDVADMALSINSIEDKFEKEDGLERQESKCEVCRKESTLKCSRCSLVYYCCKKHQTEDWKRHKPHCKQLGYRKVVEAALGNQEIKWGFLKP